MIASRGNPTVNAQVGLGSPVVASFLSLFRVGCIHERPDRPPDRLREFVPDGDQAREIGLDFTATVSCQSGALTTLLPTESPPNFTPWPLG